MNKAHTIEFLALVIVAYVFSHFVSAYDASTTSSTIYNTSYITSSSSSSYTLPSSTTSITATTSTIDTSSYTGTYATTSTTGSYTTYTYPTTTTYYDTTSTATTYYNTYPTTTTYYNTNTYSTTSTTTNVTTTATTSTRTATAVQNIYISPENPVVYVGEKIYFQAIISGVLQSGLNWVVGEGIYGGTVIDGVYTAPLAAGTFRVMAWNPVNYNWGATSVVVKDRLQTKTQVSTYSVTPTYTTSTSEEAGIPLVNEPLMQTSGYATTTTTAATPATSTTATLENEYEKATYQIINIISLSSTGEPVSLPQEEFELLYKDSNSDGISDYEPIHVYDIDPVRPSPTALYEGKKINAGEKVLLGFDPKEKELVKVAPEEPVVSEAPVADVYKVKEVGLTEDKKVVLKGRALPNSFVTVYIYSTPIIVTVKTNEEGEWQYLLDKELEDGTHEVYAATVDNTGKILAKSREFTFVKTAEAATLNSPIALDVSPEKPSFLSQVNIYIIILVFGVILVLALIFIGTKEEPKPVVDSNNSN